MGEWEREAFGLIIWGIGTQLNAELLRFADKQED